MKRSALITVLLATVIVIAALVAAGCERQPAAIREALAPVPAPKLMSFSPASGTVAGRDVSVILNFDVTMDSSSLERAAVFEPNLSFKVIISGTQAEFQPTCLLDASSNYRFTLSPNMALNADGALLERGMSVSFSTLADPVTLTVPKFGYENTVIEGPTADAVTAALGNGVGHFPGLGRPGAGNFVLFAHTSGQIDFPYNRLFDLQTGDEMILTYGGRSWTYVMKKGFVVNQDELWILDQTSQPTITFFVCSAPEGKPSPTFHPPYRYVVRAELAGAPAI